MLDTLKDHLQLEDLVKIKCAQFAVLLLDQLVDLKTLLVFILVFGFQADIRLRVRFVGRQFHDLR